LPNSGKGHERGEGLIEVHNVRLQAWSAPIVGLAVGGVVGVSASRKVAQPILWEWILCGAAAGLLAGGVIWLFQFGEPKSTKPAIATTSAVGKALPIISLILLCVPILGLVLAITGITWNRHSRGFHWRLSWIAAIVGVIMTTIFVAHEIK
jgi:hypothetical protein